MALLRVFAVFVVADTKRIVTGTAWIIGFPGPSSADENARVFFEPGDARYVDGLAGQVGHVILKDATTHSGRLMARDNATLLLVKDPAAGAIE